MNPVEKFPPFMETETSLSCLKKYPAEPYHKPLHSSSSLHTVLIHDPSSSHPRLGSPTIFFAWDLPIKILYVTVRLSCVLHGLLTLTSLM